MKQLLFLFTAFFCFTLSVYTQPGALDPSFGSGGLQTDNNHGGFIAMGVQPSGKIVVCRPGVAGTELVRYNADGTLDNSFGTEASGYIVRIRTSAQVYWFVKKMKIQPDGKIVVIAGANGSNGLNSIIRLSADGSLDATFGNGGSTNADIIGNKIWDDMDLDPDGKIIVTGYYYLSDEKNRLIISKFNKDGDPDLTFNSSGIRIVVETDDIGHKGLGCRIDGNSDIVVLEELGLRKQRLRRFKANGDIDLGFATDGYVEGVGEFNVNSKGQIAYFSAAGIVKVLKNTGADSTSFTIPDEAELRSIYFQPDNKIVLGGLYKSVSGRYDFWLMRLSDPNFGMNGQVITSFGLSAYFSDFVIKNRKIYIAGAVQVPISAEDTDSYGALAVYDGSDARLSCPNVQSSYPTDNGKCLGTVTGINAIMSTSTLYANVKYKLEQGGVVIDEGDGGVSGKLFPKGTTKVTYSYTDITTQTCSFNVTVEDKEAPKLFCPVAVQINNTTGKCYGELLQSQLGSPITTDNCSGMINLSISGIPSGNQYPIGETIITWKATDEAGNSNTCTQKVTVIDNEKPTISIGNKNVNTDLGNCYAVLSLNDLGTPVTSDNCLDGLIVTTPTLPFNNQFPKGTTQLIWKVTDASGNTATTVQTVTVTDNEPPKIENLSATPDVLTPPDRKMKAVTVNYTTSDNCGVQSAVISNITSNELVDGPGAGNTSPDWEYIDANHVRLRAERIATGSGRTYTITITCTDVSGNVSTSKVNVLVRNSIVSPKSGQAFIVNSTVNMKGEFWDKPGATHTAKWLIDDVTTAKATLSEPAGDKNGSVTGNYKFTSPGVYKLQMSITDQKGITQYTNNNGCLDALVVIYDPNGGYSYGGGWYYSNKGALVADSEAKGDVSYGYTVNYYKGATRPKGETQFKFGDFEFNAVNFDYLVVNGAYASFAGTGKITGGQSGVNFIMTVIDGQLDGSGMDKVRMKIYNKTTGQVYYDNQPGAGDNALPVAKVGDGSTVVISSAASTTVQARRNDQGISNSKLFEVKVYPNPSAADFMVSINSNNHQPAFIKITNSIGQVVQYFQTGNKNITVGKELKPGIYVVEIKQGENNQTIKLIKY